MLVATGMASARAEVGTVQGTVFDETGAVVPNARIVILNSKLGFKLETKSDPVGSFRFFNLPFNNYVIHVEAAGFRETDLQVDVHSSIPISLEVKLKASLGTIVEEVSVEHQETLELDKTATATQLHTELIARLPGASPSRGIETLIAQVPGAIQSDNGRLFIRGSHIPLQYNIDGIPINDNLSSVFASNIDARNLRTLEVITGNVPAEYGNRTAGVVNITTLSGLDIPLTGTFTASGGSFSTGELAASLGGHVKKLGFYSGVSASRTNRSLDSVSLENFNNTGGSAKGLFKVDYLLGQNDFFRFTFSFGGSDFHVTNLPYQQLAGQDQRIELRDNAQSFGWQHTFNPTTIMSLSLSRRYSESALSSNTKATPVYATQFRTLENQGVIVSVAHERSGHSLKAGVEGLRFPVREEFNFAVTNPDAFPPDDQGTPTPAAQFTLTQPFKYQGRTTGREVSFFVQDRLKVLKHLTLEAGLRYDNYDLLLSEDQVSPRLGIAYYLPKTQTVFRASYNRFFTPPARENLLLTSSAEAARLSPLAAEGGKGVQPVLPEKQHAFEVGLQQQLTRFFRLDVAYFSRHIRNMSDADQFFNSGIIFPIAISKGRATGIDVRLDLADVRGFSAFVSYSNSYTRAETPIIGGIFLGEAVESLEHPGRTFSNDHDQRNTGNFRAAYNHKSGWWIAVGGRYDSGTPVELEPGTTREEFEARGPIEGFSLRLLDAVNFDRLRARPRTVLNFSAGADLVKQDHVTISVQFDALNLSDEVYLYTFESAFSGTRVGAPRTYAARVTFKFK
jgi:outer membrane receptor protein involved in Fe transport